MSTRLEEQSTLVGLLIQAAASDFLASFSELLLASSLLERRPNDMAENPDIDKSIGKAKWHLLAAIVIFDHLSGAIEVAAESRGSTGQERRTGVPSLVAEAVRRGLLVDCPPAATLVSKVISAHNLKEVIPAFRSELVSCRDAIDRIDLRSSRVVVQLHTALTAYANSMIKGQHVAYLNRMSPASSPQK